MAGKFKIWSLAVLKNTLKIKRKKRGISMKRLSESELEIMLAIWRGNGPVNSTYVREAMSEKGWAKTTVLNFLARLVDKGFLKCESQGKSNIYTPLVREEDYMKLKNKNFLKKFYDNSIKNMVVALYQDQIISDKDLEELK
jgi:BlaI family penicillinase repressor